MARQLFLLFILLLTLFAACQQPAPATPQATDEHIKQYATSVAQATRISARAAERLEIRWFVGLGNTPTPRQEETLQLLATRFNEAQSDIWLQLVVVPGEEAYQTLLDLQAADELPDLIGPIGLREGNYFGEDWLDLRPYLPQHQFDLDAFSPQSLAYYEQDDALTGLPLNLHPSFIYFNRDAFDKAGLAYPPQQFGDPYADGDAWDMAKLTELAIQLTHDSSGNVSGSAAFDPIEIAQFGYINQFTDYTREGLTPFGAGVLIDGDGNAAMPDAWRDGVVWTYEAMWTHRLYPHQQDQYSDLFAHANTFRSGHVAMATAPLWFTRHMGQADFAWDIAVMPSYQGDTTAKTHSDGFRIFADTPHPEEAAQVLSWLMSDGYETLFLRYGGIPSRSDEYQQQLLERLDAHYPDDIAWHVAIDSLAYADAPHHQAPLPNYAQAEMAERLFWSLLETTPGLEIEAEIDAFVAHLQAVYEETSPE